MNSETNTKKESSGQLKIETLDDCRRALEMAMSNSGLLLTEAQLSPAFFNLSTGVAGELFQKFMNYNLALALVVPEPMRYSERITELAREHTNHSNIRFFTDIESARDWILSKSQK